jgi:lipopolysaccharide transport system ATP-binding protein
VSNGASGVLVTHDWAAIVKLCETAHVLDRGRLIYSGPAEHAARHYLYGEAKRSSFRVGIARFVDQVSYPREVRSGEDFLLEAEVEMLEPASVGCVLAIERMQPGFGWETALMSRRVAPVGEHPGRYAIEVAVPALPLGPGSYQISLQLVMPDSDNPGLRVVLDGYGWLDGNGLPLDIVGELDRGLALPTSWTLETQ